MIDASFFDDIIIVQKQYEKGDIKAARRGVSVGL